MLFLDKRNSTGNLYLGGSDSQPHPLAAAFLNARAGGSVIGTTGKPPAPPPGSTGQTPGRPGLMRTRSEDLSAEQEINTHDLVSEELKEAAGI